jgi:aminoglycoside phosphotransferase (APT) family kinase protein
MSDGRVFPLIEVSREELTRLTGGKPIAKIERVDGGLTNTIHKVALESGELYAVKHYAGGKDAFEAELVTLTLLHGTLPVPDVVEADADHHVIVYRWIDGITLNDLRKAEPRSVGSLAEPLGRYLAWLARTDATEPFELAAILERAYRQLVDGRARQRLGAPLADALHKALEAHEPQLAWGTVCLVHGDLGGRNVLVIGSLFRNTSRFEAEFATAFERGYREADGTLPDGWLLTSRLLDATWLIDTLDEPREFPGVYADCRMLLAGLAKDLG